MDIRYSPETMRESAEVLRDTYRFALPKRVPVILGIEARYILHERGGTFAEYFSDVRTQFVHQLENFKWRVEHIPDDAFAEPVVTVSPDFQNVVNASGCGCEIYWQEDETPQSTPRLSTVEEMVGYTLPPWQTTLWGKKLEWYSVMKELAADADVRLNGERIPVRVVLSIGGDSPFMSAVDLAGFHFYEWLLQAERECMRFLGIIADRYVEVETHYRKVTGRSLNDGLNYSDDSAQVISPAVYRKFCIPIAERLYGMFGCDRFDGRLMHLCGRNVHLHDALKDLRITMLHGYGSANKPGEMLTLAGKAILQGDIDPMTLFRGNELEIESEARDVLETLAPFGGIVLGDGYNVVPGTRLESLAMLKRVSGEFGRPVRQNPFLERH
ncbi:MAG: hypothetical protein HY563_03355 [Ignavibacteriales bacterium]|nr:hypothetical protein [Ignavibacteriales bacterium]